MPLSLTTTLRRLSEAFGPTGEEEPIAAVVQELLAPYCENAAVDSMFSVVGVRPGSGPEPRPRLAFVAHLDEVHLRVTAVEGAFLRVRTYGYDPRVLVGQEVTVFGAEPLTGVIGDRAPHVLNASERGRMPHERDLLVDVGLDAATLAATVRAGDVVLLHQPFLDLLGERVAGKAFDDRLSILVLLAMLEHLQEIRHTCDVIVVASSGEELTYLGATTSGYRLQPDLAVVLDLTFASQPGTGEALTFDLGAGPVLAVGPSLHPRLADKLVAVAEEWEIEHNVEPAGGSTDTDAWAFEVAGRGIPCALLQVPVRNMHSPLEVADLDDVARLARWLALFASKVDSAFVDSLRYRLPDLPEMPA